MITDAQRRKHTSLATITVLAMIAASLGVTHSAAQTCGPPTVMGPSCGAIGSIISCTKSVLPTQSCTTSVMVGTKGTTGDYLGGFGTVIPGSFLCYRPTTVTGSGFCSVSCDCGKLIIDNSDGLPVELMEFGVNEEEPVDAAPRVEPFGRTQS